MKSLVCSTFAAALICGCAETATGPTDDEAAFVAWVSDPGAETSNAHRGRLSASSGVLDPLVWLSLPPASVPAGVVTAENLRTGASVLAPVVRGGFDPVPLAAEAGDTLRLAIDLSNGGMEATRIVVPARRRPRVVRTSPVAGRRDVAINSSVVVVFSEPIATSSVDPANVRVLRGSAELPGTVRFVDGSPTSVEFVPASPFEPGAAYQLVIGTGIVDLSGDPIEGSLTVPFNTVEEGPASALGVLALSVRGIVAFEPGGTYFEELSDPAAGRPDDYLTHDRYPAWSPDGSRVAFGRITRLTDPAGPVTAIHVMNADGSNLVRITPEDGHAMRPSWSPDGSRIAFQVRRDDVGSDDVYAENEADIHVMNADGSNPVRLVNSEGPSWGAAWSPDGGRIAYAGRPEPGRIDIFTINPDGSGVVNLTNDLSPDTDPDWSPDGSRIAFVKNGDLYVMNADGTNATRVAEAPGRDVFIVKPIWSPDGLSILYATYTPCGWWLDTCPDPEAPATVVRLSDGMKSPLPAAVEGMFADRAGHWSWRP